MDEDFSTDLEGFFACGNVVSVFDLVDYVTLVAERAGRAAVFPSSPQKNIFYKQEKGCIHSYSANKGRERRFFIYSAAKEHEKCNGISSMGRKDILRKEDIDLPAQ